MSKIEIGERTLTQVSPAPELAQLRGEVDQATTLAGQAELDRLLRRLPGLLTRSKPRGKGTF